MMSDVTEGEANGNPVENSIPLQTPRPPLTLDDLPGPPSLLNNDPRAGRIVRLKVLVFPLPIEAG